MVEWLSLRGYLTLPRQRHSHQVYLRINGTNAEASSIQNIPRKNPTTISRIRIRAQTGSVVNVILPFNNSIIEDGPGDFIATKQENNFGKICLIN